MVKDIKYFKLKHHVYVVYVFNLCNYRNLIVLSKDNYVN